MGAVVAVLALSGCVATAPQVERPVALAEGALLEQGIQFAVDDLLAQAIKTPGFWPQPKNALEQLLKADAAKQSGKPLLLS